ncbi:MAG: hypothetical protein A2V65_03025 [Deltaproteobacteria bacterium RBG_13_49_15]|nr:MAG: hypothetical protein A2V65_03025 [Deltaproteobacteria bacterium RBG_13_49_15]
MKFKSSGFTLVEVLIAVFIFGIIATTIFGSYHSVFSNAQELNNRISDDEMGMGCLTRMTRDLSSAVISLPPQYRSPKLNAKPDPHRFLSQNDLLAGLNFSSLRFTSLSHTPMDIRLPDRISEIIYYIDQTGQDQYVLRRADHPYPFFDQTKSKKDPILCENIKSISFTYYDQDGKTYDRWDSESADFGYATPKGIEIRLEIGEGDPPRVFETGTGIPSWRMKTNR